MTPSWFFRGRIHGGDEFFFAIATLLCRDRGRIIGEGVGVGRSRCWLVVMVVEVVGTGVWVELGGRDDTITIPTLKFENFPASFRRSPDPCHQKFPEKLSSMIFLVFSTSQAFFSKFVWPYSFSLSGSLS